MAVAFVVEAAGVALLPDKRLKIANSLVRHVVAFRVVARLYIDVWCEI